MRSLSIMNIPGKLYLHSMPGRYESMEVFEKSFREHNITHLVSLAGDKEISKKSPAYLAYLESGDPVWSNRWTYPVIDFGVPDEYKKYHDLALAVADALHKGEHVLVY